MKPMDLDTTRQQDLYTRACQDMASKLPGWTDDYPSDPAVAILEHLTYLSDIQNYVLNQVQDDHYLAYCKLLGASPRPLAPARLLALPDRFVPCCWGERFFIDHIPFEISKAPQADLPQIHEVSLTTAHGTRILSPDTPLSLEGNLPGQLTLRLSGPLPSGRRISFWLAVTQDEGRNLPAAQTPPPVTLQVIFPSSQEQDIPCTDGTCGFLQSGFVTCTLPQETDTVTFSLTGSWEGLLRLSQVVLEPIQLTQQHTRSACIDLTAPFSIPPAWSGTRELFYFVPWGEGWKQMVFYLDPGGHVTGWTDAPPQIIRVAAVEPDFHALCSLQGIAMETLSIQEDGLWPDALQVMVEEDGVWYDFPVCQPVEGKTLSRGCRWEAKSRTLRFGDGRDYLPPPQGQVLIVSCVRTLGGAGSGVMGPLVREDGAALIPLTPAQGGQDAEPPRDAFLRAAREQEEPMRAVTCRDYELLARRAPGLALERVRALPKRRLGGTGPGVVLLAKPKSHLPQPVLTSWQQKCLSDFLSPCRLLGMPLEIRGPRYCPLRVQVTLLTTEPVDQDSLYQAALSLTDGVTGPLDFGAEISYTGLYAALGSVAHVRTVQKLELTTLTEEVTRLPDGSLQPAPDMLPYLAQFHVSQSQ